MKKYKFPDRYEKKSECFTLEADGINIDVYSCDVSAYPFNRVWEGKQRDKSQFAQLIRNNPLLLFLEHHLLQRKRKYTKE